MKKILALFLAVIFVFSAMPVYAAEVESVTVEPRATVCNVANYLTKDREDHHQFVVSNTGYYTVTIVVGDPTGAGAWIRFGWVRKNAIFNKTVSGRYQDGVVGDEQLYLLAGTYDLNIKANENLSYSIIISN